MIAHVGVGGDGRPNPASSGAPTLLQPMTGCCMSQATVSRIDTALLAKVLGRLGSDQPGEVLAAAKQATSMLARAGASWRDVLAPSAPKAPIANPVTLRDGRTLLPPLSGCWRASAIFLAQRRAGQNDFENRFLDALAAGRWINPRGITPKQAETITMIYRRTAGLPA